MLFRFAITSIIFILSNACVQTVYPAPLIVNQNKEKEKEKDTPDHYLVVSVMTESPEDLKYHLWNIVQNHLDSMTLEKKAEVWEEMNARIQHEKVDEGVWWRLSPWKPAHKRCYRDVMQEIKSGCSALSKDYDWFKKTVEKLSSCVMKEKHGCASENLMISALYVFQLPLLCLQSTQDDIKSLQKEITIILDGELKIAREKLSIQNVSTLKKEAELKQVKIDLIEAEKRTQAANAEKSAAQREVQLVRKEVELVTKDVEHYLKDINSKIDIIEFQKKTITSREESNAHLYQLYTELKVNCDKDREYAKGRWGCLSGLTSYNGRQPWMCKFLPVLKRYSGPFNYGIEFVNEICLQDGIPNFIRDGFMMIIMFSMLLGFISVLKRCEIRYALMPFLPFTRAVQFSCAFLRNKNEKNERKICYNMIPKKVKPIDDENAHDGKVGYDAGGALDIGNAKDARDGENTRPSYVKTTRRRTHK